MQKLLTTTSATVLLLALAACAPGNTDFPDTGGSVSSPPAVSSRMTSSSSSLQSSSASSSLSQSSISVNNPSSQPEARTIQMEAGMFYYAPAAITVQRGQPITIVFDVVGGNHDFVIDELNVSSGLLTGDNPSVTFTPQQTGTFAYYCSVPGHREQGMEGVITVTE